MDQVGDPTSLQVAQCSAQHGADCGDRASHRPPNRWNHAPQRSSRPGQPGTYYHLFLSNWHGEEPGHAIGGGRGWIG